MQLKLDRALQRKLLEDLAPHYTGAPQFLIGKEMPKEERDSIIFNLRYLQAHGLVESGLTKFMDGKWAQSGAFITHDGLDFLEADGGLSAILGVVMVKFHDDTIKQIFETHIQASNLPAVEKTGFLDQLRQLRGESIKHLTLKLLDAAADNLPAVLRSIQTLG
ncbi:hypothetical protein ACWYXJ_12535 [Janthinobacterium lividum]